MSARHHRGSASAAASACAGRARHLPFLAGSGIADITPPLEVGLLMSSVEQQWAPFKGVRLPLHARALVLESEERRLALVCLELLGLSEEAMGGMSLFRQAIVDASGGGLSTEDLVLTCIHTHSAPETLGLSALRHTPAYQSWTRTLVARIAEAIRAGAENLRPCSLSVASALAPELVMHRRIQTTHGILLSHPEPAPEIVLSREGAVDDTVQLAVFRDEANEVAAMVVNAACHPVHEMCSPYVSPDYPGVMSRALEKQFPGTHVLFLNGAAGNLNPPTVSGGAAVADAHGLRLAELVDHAMAEAIPVQGSKVALVGSAIELPARSVNGMGQARPIPARLAAMRLGEVALCFLPGEPFAETGLAIRDRSPFPCTLVAGYSEGSIGYVPTREAYRQGGYETGPGAWSPLAPGCEEVIRSQALSLLQQLRATSSPASARNVEPASGRA